MTTVDLATTGKIVPASSAAPLMERLRNAAWEFDFFQAAWLFERYFAGGVAVGQRGPMARERLRFRPDVSLGFPATDVSRVVETNDADNGKPAHLLEVTFLGLYGVSTPLPLHYGVDVLRAVERGGGAHHEPGGGHDVHGEAARPLGSSATRDFLDVFHHRVISLFYRSWLKYRYERMFGSAERDAITHYLRLLIGCPDSFDESVLGVPPIRLLRYAGVLTQTPRSATTLEGVLADYWEDIPFKITQFLGQWVPIGEADQNRLGAANSGLGVDMTIGDQVYDLGGAFTIEVGPVDWDTYLSLVPGGDRYEQTRDLTRLYCRDPLAFTMQVTLEAGAVPETRLTLDDRAGRLGMTTWVRTEELGETSVTFAASETAAAPG